MPPEATAFVVLAFAFLFGANVGSFLNVVAHRVPLGLSVVRPRSRCPACRTPVRAADNVPIVSWVLLGARCRGCKGRISWRYPAVEAMVGLVAMACVHVLVLRSPAPPGDPAPWLHAAAVFCVSAALAAAALIDVDHQILPDSITIPGMWGVPVLAALVPELTLGPAREVPGWLGNCPLRLASLAVSVLGLATGALLIWGLGAVGTRIFRKEAMGFGDVKYMGMIGGAVGPAGALLAIVVAAFAGSVAGLVRVVLTRDRYIPFGPFLAIGGFFAMLHGRDFIAWYLARFVGV